MILQVLKDTHPRLRMKAEPANVKLPALRLLARSMFETMMSHGALGLACNQVRSGWLVRVIAVNAPGLRTIMFNPVITEKSEEIYKIKEGCLSVKQQVEVPRAKKITVSFYSVVGEPKEITVEDLAAVVVQHEIDHLDGKIITDYL